MNGRRGKNKKYDKREKMVEERSGRTALKPALSEAVSRLRGDCGAVWGKNLPGVRESALAGAGTLLQEMWKRDFGSTRRVLSGLHASSKNV